jgi:hypothetical protein
MTRSAEEVTVEVTKALIEVLKNGFQKCFQNLYEHYQKVVTAHYFEANVM